MPALYHIGETSTHDVVIFPIIQGGQFGIREEERALAMLFDEIDRNANQSVPAMDITSGYFGIYKDYCSLMLQSRMGCRILAASPKVKEFDLFYIALLKGFYRPTVFTDLEAYLVVYLKDIPFSSNALCVQYAMRGVCRVQATQGLVFRNGRRTDGHIMPRVRV